MITGIARILQQGAKARVRCDRAGEECGTTVGRFFLNSRIKKIFVVAHYILIIRPHVFQFLFSLSNQWGGGGGLGPCTPLYATPVTVV